ncbi:DMT family transporter, partial [Candidatus Uhrbacteria bacterium]|nr:DMT family transporter [Candidatus Uhrbacteria bacterium]
MSWLLIVSVAHLMNAGAFLVDKFLLARAVPKPVVYAFWIGVLGLLALLLLPFGFAIPTPAVFGLALLAGCTFEIALVFFFIALRYLDASRVIPVVGGLQPILIFAFAYTFLQERLSQTEVAAFALLVLGSILISYENGKRSIAATTRARRGWYAAVGAALFFSISFTVTKSVFDATIFFSGLAWIRVGAFLTVILFLLYAPWRRDILEKQDFPSGALRMLFVVGQVGGALASVLLQYAVKLATPTLVSAMQGLQYAFLFVLAVVLGR